MTIDDAGRQLRGCQICHPTPIMYCDSCQEAGTVLRDSGVLDACARLAGFDSFDHFCATMTSLRIH
jgi:hypothetical protein